VILGEGLNFDKEQATKMATPFGGGMSRFGMICGTLVGGAMAIGTCFGRTKAEEKDKREKTYSKVQGLLRGFEKEYGTLQCRELIGLNLLDPADQKKFQELKLTERCAGFAASAVEMARQQIKE